MRTILLLLGIGIAMLSLFCVEYILIYRDEKSEIKRMVKSLVSSLSPVSYMLMCYSLVFMDSIFTILIYPTVLAIFSRFRYYGPTLLLKENRIYILWLFIFIAICSISILINAKEWSMAVLSIILDTFLVVVGVLKLRTSISNK